MNRETEVEREVAALGDLPRKVLAERWAEAYGASPAADVSPALMRKALAWEIQARAFGSHSAQTLRSLKAIAAGKPAPKTAAAGTRLVREWNGATYEVEVLGSGYRWRGATWASLSAIAKAITGAKWSGPRFFGLAKRIVLGEEAVDPDAAFVNGLIKANAWLNEIKAGASIASIAEREAVSRQRINQA